MSGMDGSVEDLQNGTEAQNESFLRFSPTSVSTGAAAASLYTHTANVLKNIISSSSSFPECNSEAGSSFTNMEICSISSQRSTVSSLS
ncbi:hypothetical protein DNTS_022186 [Danionella cerebrum]|uniref:Uncharacterized protein n=1 Tax=Danionella cerebrum TaxID=2873325 RepID=A0A553QMK3_9TELE|nr:hypothetical protein DNTS_022186 [Danionella translucida]